MAALGGAGDAVEHAIGERPPGADGAPSGRAPSECVPTVVVTVIYFVSGSVATIERTQHVNSKSNPVHYI